MYKTHRIHAANISILREVLLISSVTISVMLVSMSPAHAAPFFDVLCRIANMGQDFAISVATLGIIAVACGAIAGKFSWGTAALTAGGISVFGFAGTVINYLINTSYYTCSGLV